MRNVEANDPARSATESSDAVGTQYPQYGQRVPVAWSADARHLIPECPLDGHEQTA